MRASLVLLTFVVLVPFDSRPAAGQVVRGVVLEAAELAPVQGAMVVMLGESAAVHSSIITNEAGRFTLRARTAGSYALRVQRIGFRDTDTDAFELRDGETVERDIRVAHETIALAPITAEAQSRCVVRPTAGLAVASLWEEARKALLATALTSDRYRFTISLYTRQLDRGTLRTVQESSRQRTGPSTASPLVSLPAEHLLTRGFIEATDSGVMYYAPDAHVLLSDEFLDEYCFHVARDDRRQHPGLIGLAFGPVSRRGPPAIRGTLWLDQSSFELRYLEYSYVRYAMPDGPADRLGGRVEFEVLPNGTWIVRRYWIRMPVVESRTVRWGPREVVRPVVTSIVEEGSEVLEIVDSPGRARLPRR